ncbi:hypothetical protein FQA39_LY03360 [Lamprigera yunnana]|nr:hypothetical protein FQA39_LY03360 [Lamprigera yunnana]
MLPEFIRIQEENHIMSLFKEVLIIEDLKVLGFQLLNHRVSIDYNQALMVMKALGKLHAISFAIRDQKPNLFNEFCVNTEEEFYNGTMYEPITEILKNNGTKITQRLKNVNNFYSKTFKQLFVKLPIIVNTIVQSQLSNNYSKDLGSCMLKYNELYKYLLGLKTSNQKLFTDYIEQAIKSIEATNGMNESDKSLSDIVPPRKKMKVLFAFDSNRD